MFLFRRALITVFFVLLGPANFVVAAEETKTPGKNEILAHPDVRGALAAIDAWIEGVHIYRKVPGISVGIVRDQDLIWNNGYGMDAAIADYRFLVRLDPWDLESTLGLATALARKGKGRQARRYFRSARSLDLRREYGDVIGDELKRFSVRHKKSAT